MDMANPLINLRRASANVAAFNEYLSKQRVAPIPKKGKPAAKAAKTPDEVWSEAAGVAPVVKPAAPTAASVPSSTPMNPVQPTPVLKTPSLAGTTGRIKQLNEILVDVNAPVARNKNMGAPFAPVDVKTAQDRLDVAKLDDQRSQVAKDREFSDVNRFYQTGGFSGIRGGDWLSSPSGRWEDTRAARITGDILSDGAQALRKEELSRMYQVGVGGDPSRGGAHLREAARLRGVRAAGLEREAAEKERADAYYAHWREQNRLRREQQADMRGGFTFGAFAERANGRHSRSPVASADKFSLIARSFGM